MLKAMPSFFIIHVFHEFLQDHWDTYSKLQKIKKEEEEFLLVLPSAYTVTAAPIFVAHGRVKK